MSSVGRASADALLPAPDPAPAQLDRLLSMTGQIPAPGIELRAGAARAVRTPLGPAHQPLQRHQEVAPSALATALSKPHSRKVRGHNRCAMAPEVGIQRVYDGAPDKRAAVLVDRVWPRGITKEQLGSAVWMREIAPSDELRRWFGHRAERWVEFRRRYRAELDRTPRRDLVDELIELARKGPITLLYGARDTERNQAAVIREVLEERLRS